MSGQAEGSGERAAANIIGQAEAALVEALAEVMPELEVIPFPEAPAEYEFIHPVGAVLVQYDGGSISPPDTLDLVRQRRELNFTVVSVTRNLRGPCGCYEVLARIRDALLGLSVCGCDPAYQTSEQFMDETDGIWTYAQGFALRTMQVQGLPNLAARDSIYEDYLE